MEQYEVLSFCGIYCGGCRNYKENMNCMGCRYEEELVNDCPTRTCCKDKGLLHCGECELFPCNEINQFYYDGKPSHELAYQNMLVIKEIGPEQWLMNQQANQTCKCGGVTTQKQRRANYD